MCFPSAVWPNFWDPLMLKIFVVYGYSIKKNTQHSIIWRWAVLCKKQDCSRIKICETFSGNSLKEDPSIDTTFDPCFFHETVPLSNSNLFKYIKVTFFQGFSCRARTAIHRDFGCYRILYIISLVENIILFQELCEMKF